jgi:hypothetical protein
MNTADDWAEEACEARRRRDERCRCGNPDLPGRCPGPAFCPMCQIDEGDE